MHTLSVSSASPVKWFPMRAQNSWMNSLSSSLVLHISMTSWGFFWNFSIAPLNLGSVNCLESFGCARIFDSKSSVTHSILKRVIWNLCTVRYSVRGVKILVRITRHRFVILWCWYLGNQTHNNYISICVALWCDLKWYRQRAVKWPKQSLWSSADDEPNHFELEMDHQKTYMKMEKCMFSVFL